MKTLLIIGSDSASSWLAKKLESEKNINVAIYKDKSGGIRRIIKLIKSGRITLLALINLIVAETLRKKEKAQFDGAITSNKDIKKLISELNPDRLLCFRCGLIINKDIINSGLPVYNIHVSDLPRFPGLGTIWRSIKEQAWAQNACLHHIDEGIDTGTVLLKKKYTMMPHLSYKKNEDIAYLAGIDLALEFLEN